MKVTLSTGSVCNWKDVNGFLANPRPWSFIDHGLICGQSHLIVASNSLFYDRVPLLIFKIDITLLWGIKN